jgi:2-polyprenyl-3-methyl-5-hydroxy-6-metoxy-1,4-benzoquinol methylase
MPYQCCEITDQAFGEEYAQAAIREYRRRGPPRQTREILSSIRAVGLKDATLLDVGGGVGSIHHELLNDVARQATHVDASSAYLREAREEAARRGHADRVKFIQADFTDVAADLPRVDIVTLDRVVCCYPDFRGLLRAAAGRSRRLIVMTYPRETWWLRIGFRVANTFMNMRRGAFRIFLHPVHEMDELLKKEGMQLISLKRLVIWEVALYARL